MLISNWLSWFRGRTPQATNRSTSRRALRQRNKTSRGAAAVERLEDRCLLAAPGLVSIIANDGSFLIDGQVRDTAPRELLLRFNEGQTLDPATFDTGIQLVRAGFDGDFGANDEVAVESLRLLQGDRPNEVVMRFGESLPNDVYQLRIFGTDPDGSGPFGPLTNAGGEAFNDDGPNAPNLVRGFTLDLGAQVVAVDPQPVLREKIVSISEPAVAALVDGDTLTIQAGGSPVVFEFDDDGQTVGGRTAVAIGPNASATADNLATAINSTPELELAEAVSAVGSRISLRGEDFTPTFSHTLTNGRTPTGPGALSVLDGALEQRTHLINVYFNANDPLDPALAENPAFYQAVDPETGAVLVPTDVEFHADINVATLNFRTNPSDPNSNLLDAGTVYTLRVGASTEVVNSLDPADPTLQENAAVALNVGTLYTSNPFTTDAFLGDQMTPGATSLNADDVDLYKVRLDQPNSSLTINVNPAAGLDTKVRLFEVTNPGTPMQDANEITSPATFAEGTDGQPDSYEFTGLAAGVYLVGISSQGNNTYDAQDGDGAQGGSGTGGYELTLSTTNVLNLGSDDNSSYGTATGLDVLGAAGQRITGRSILPQPVALPPEPGGLDEPGHRIIQIAGENHLGSSGQTPVLFNGIPTFFYNFRDVYGQDPNGNALQNAITEVQKQRVREVFELYSRVSGIQFVESANSGFIIATGDLRAVNPTSPTGPDGPGGFAGGSLAVMNAARNWGDSEYGGEYFTTAMHEVGHLLGLGHVGELPAIMNGGSETSDPDQAIPYGEPVFPAHADIVHMRRLYARHSIDIDLYQFQLDESGQFTAETIAERLAPDASGLDTVLMLFRELTVGEGTADEKTTRELIARNDDFFGADSQIDVQLDATDALGNRYTYYVGVSSVGNANYNPNVSDSGSEGRTQGRYDLQLHFAAGRSTPLVDAVSAADPASTAVDGDGDGRPGGTFAFSFQAGNESNTIYVDKAAASATADGTIANPYTEIDQALEAARQFAESTPGQGRIVRIVGNGGLDGLASTLADNNSYLVGLDDTFSPLADGEEFLIPQNTVVMVTAGAVIKLQEANIDVGTSAQNVDRSGGALQILGLPDVFDFDPADNGGAVYLTSYHNDKFGGDSNGVAPPPAAGDWGGLVFRGDSDFDNSSAVAPAFLNSVNQANISYGGGQVLVNTQMQAFDAIHVIDARPTITFNTIYGNAGAAISANPNSFREDTAPDLAPELRRLGPEIHGNRLSAPDPYDPSVTIQNTINGLFVRIETQSGVPTNTLDVAARFRATDIVYVLNENLQITGGPGGRVLDPLTGDIVARPAGRLLIEPGVVLKLEGARIEADLGRANLIAEGTAADPIVFTSTFDDRYGGGGVFDTTSDSQPGNTPQDPDRGDWGGLVFNANSGGSIDYALITFAGGVTPIEGAFATFNPVEIHQADVRIANARFEANADGTGQGGDRNGRGGNAAATIFVRGAQPVIVGNIFEDSAGDAISIDLNSLLAVVSPDWGVATGRLDRVSEHSAYFNNGERDALYTGFADNYGPLVRLNRLDMGAGGMNALHVRGGLLTTASVWDDTDIVHVLTDEIIVDNHHTFSGLRLQSSAGESLVVKLSGSTAGFTATGTEIDINDRIGGTVQVIGVSGKPVVFTSLNDNTVGAGLRPDGIPQLNTVAPGTAPAAGDWRSLRFERLSNDRNVAVVNELEAGAGELASDENGTARSARFVGELAAHQKDGDDVRRLGFEIHGTINHDSPRDHDVYSFRAKAGSEVWIDIDQTWGALDAVIELVDIRGRVLARSYDNQTFEALGPGMDGRVFTLEKDPRDGGDFYTVNPNDPGMRIVLPGTTGQIFTYFVRVRSRADVEGATLGAGQTSGKYQLNIRLRQTDERSGSTVRYADIRYATNGIEVFGLPGHSPLVGESTEAYNDANGADLNDTFNAAQQLGNLLEIDRNTISVGGTLDAESDVDWYQFSLDYNFIQAIGGFGNISKTFATLFDVDYADGIARPNTTLSVFDQDGNLVLISRDSDVVEDQPGPTEGADLDDLSRGSAGVLDPFIGSVQMPTGNIPGGVNVTYFVAISSDHFLPNAVNFQYLGGPGGNAAQQLIRLEPVNSVQRIVEDHIGVDQLGYATGNENGFASFVEPNDEIDAGDTTAALIDTTSEITLAAHVVPFTLEDVALFVSAGGSSSLRIVNPSAGGVVTGDDFTNPNGISDIKIRNDGTIWGYRNVNGGGQAGNLVRLDSRGGVIAEVGDGIPNIPNPAPNPPNRNQLNTNSVGALAWGGVGVNDNDDYTLYYAVHGVHPADGGGSNSSTLFFANPDNGSAAFVDGQPWGYQGEIFAVNRGDLGRTEGMEFLNGTLYGVSNSGLFYRINPANGRASSVVQVLEPGEGFTGLTLGPQNVEGGIYADLLFATTDDGRLLALNAAGQPQAIFAGGATEISTGVGSPTGLAFSPLDFNLWHPTLRREGDAGHGVNNAFDNSRTETGLGVDIVGGQRDGTTLGAAAGGVSFYFGLEDWAQRNARRYHHYESDGQLGVLDGTFQRDLTRSMAGTIGGDPNIRDNYNLPGGAMGSLTTNGFSLVGYGRTDKPTLYFNYFLDTQGAAGTTANNQMRDAARVFISRDDGQTWELVATNNSTPSGSDFGPNAELPRFQSTSADANVFNPHQRIQELFDTSGTWRQARVDLAEYVGEGNLRLRFDFTTAGVIHNADDSPDNRLSVGNNADATGNINSATRGEDNAHEGFYIDDIVVGFAERGEMVTGATNLTNYSQVPQNPTFGSGSPVLVGDYQLEIRRGEEYGFLMNRVLSNIIIGNQLDTNDRLAQADTLLAPAGSGLSDGQAFTLSDGVNTITFEFDSDGSVTPADANGRPVIAIAFNPADTDAQVANAIAAAINSVHQRNDLNLVPAWPVRASSVATSNEVEIFNAVTFGAVTAPQDVTVLLDDGFIAENGGSTGVTITREGDLTQSLTVALEVIDPELDVLTTDAAFSSSTAFFAAGSNTATDPNGDPITLTATNNTDAEGNATVILRATATGYNSVTDAVDVIDDDTPTLTVTAAATEIFEDAADGTTSTTVTVTWNTPLAPADLVLTGLDSSEVTVQLQSTTANSATFLVTSVNDAIADGPVAVTLVASAVGYASDSDQVTVRDNVADPDQTPNTTYNVGPNVQGTDIYEAGMAFPPDVSGAVSSDWVVEMVNGSFAVYDADTGAQFDVNAADTTRMNLTLDEFWTATEGDVTIPTDTSTSEPRVVYDKASDRWFAVSIDSANGGAGNNIYLAVSETPDPAGSWIGFRFVGDSPGELTVRDIALGVDGDAVTIAVNNFSGSSTTVSSVSLYLLPKADLDGTNGPPNTGRLTRIARLPVNDSIDPITGAFRPGYGVFLQPVLEVEGTADGQGWLLSTDPLSGPTANSNEIHQIRIAGLSNGAWNPRIGFVRDITVTPYRTAPAGRQPLTPDNIENASPEFSGNAVLVGDDLWAVHAVLDSQNDSSGLHWYRIDVNSGVILEDDLISYDDLNPGANPNELDFYDPSIAANEFGDIVIGFSGSGDAQPISSYAVFGRTVNGATTFSYFDEDGNRSPLSSGTLEPLVEGAGTYDRQSSTTNPWGRHSATVIDPDNPFSFWTFQEYTTDVDLDPLTMNEWAIQITRLNLLSDQRDLVVNIVDGSAAENGGPVTATVTRTGDLTNGLTVTLTSSDPSQATVSSTATFAPGSAVSSTFFIFPVNNDGGTADGTHTVFVTASAIDYNSVLDRIDITDDEMPELTLTVTPSFISEADGVGAATGTITRNTPTDEDQFVWLTSSDTSEATVPQMVVIPAGETEVTFLIDAVNELFTDQTRLVRIFASAPDFFRGEDTLLVSPEAGGGAGLTTVDRLGDQNLPRQQGQFLIEQNLIRNVSQVGILVDAAPRSDNRPHPGGVINTPVINNDRLARGTTITNNVVADFGQVGIRFSGDPNTGNSPLAAVPFGRIVNNTVYGGATAAGIGIEVTENASPTVLNNIVANTATGIDVDGTSRSTVVGATAFKGNTSNGTTGTNARVLSAGDPLFVNPSQYNFYLRDDSPAIDSSLNSLQDRPGLTNVTGPLGISQSNILAPDLDAFGQLRVDDPSQAPPPGLGSNVFKDRGAVERADFNGPVIQLADPADNVSPDLDPDANEVQLDSPTQRQFVLKLSDLGIGIDTGTVTSSRFDVAFNGVLLNDGRDPGAPVDYLFTYNTNTNEVIFTAASGVFAFGSYTITVDNSAATGIRDLAGTPLRANRADGTTRFNLELSPGSVTISDAVAVEGDFGTPNSMVFVLTLSDTLEVPVSVDYVLVNGSADAGQDFVLPAGNRGTVTFQANTLKALISVPIIGDLLLEGDQTFTVQLMNNPNSLNVAFQDGTAIGTIDDDDDAPKLAINDVSRAEGDGGPGSSIFNFTVTLTTNPSGTVVVNYETGNGTALAGQDYVGETGQVTFTGSERQKTISIVVNGDDMNEGDETFFVTLTSASGATIVRSQGTGTVQDDDPPLISISDASAGEGDSGTTTATFTVTLSSPSVTEQRVSFTTANGSAAAGSDYQSISGELIFAPGETSKPITVTINGDTDQEVNETFVVNLSGHPSIVDNQGVGTILDNDAPRLTVSDVLRNERIGGNTATFTVSLDRPATGTVTVNYQTVNGTAVAGSDYSATSGTLTFAPGETSKTVGVPIFIDGVPEGTEYFSLNTTVSGSPVLVAKGRGVATLRDTVNLVTGVDAPGGPHVQVFDAVTGSERFEFLAYDASFGGGVRVATGDVNGDRVDDIITTPGAGGNPLVRIYSGVNGAFLGEIAAYPPNTTTGLHVAVGDVNGDGFADIITAPDTRGGPHIRIFDGRTRTMMHEFLAFDGGFTGGVRLAAGDMDDDGRADIIAAQGPGGNQLRVFSGSAAMNRVTDELEQYRLTPYGGFQGGMFVASADIDGDGRDDLLTGAGAGGGPHVIAFRVTDSGVGMIHSFNAYEPSFSGGVRVAAGFVDGDNRADIITAPGSGRTAEVRTFSGANLAPIRAPFQPYGGFTGGTFVAGSGHDAPPPTGSPLRAAGGVATTDSRTSTSTLTAAQLQTTVTAAIDRLVESGLSTGSAAELRDVRFEVQDLSGDLLGLALPGLILLDVNAAGYGWFIDATPLADEEFRAALESGMVATDARATGRMDLLTVILHELGHQRGESDLDPAGHEDHLMAATLATGERRLPDDESDLDSFFAGDALADLMLSGL